MATDIFMRSEADIFSEPGYDMTIQSTCVNQYHPVSTLTETSPIEFFVQGNDQQYLDLANTKLKVRFKVVDADNSDIAKTTNTNKDVYFYAPVNYLIASAFDRVSVHLNEIEVTPKNSLYPYQAYLETLLSYGSEYKKGQAEAGGYYRTKDETKTDGSDEGWKFRQILCDGSAEFELIGRPHGEIFSQPRYMIPGIDFRAAFYRTTSAFAMHSLGTTPKRVKLKILDASMFIKKVTLLPSLHLYHLKEWQKHPCVYPSKRIAMKSYSLAAGTHQHNNENILHGLIPDRVIIGLVPSANFNGAYGLSPFDFNADKIDQIIITVNSETTSQHIINFNKDENKILDGFISLYDAMGLTNCDDGLDIRLAEYMKGKALFGFDLRNLADGFVLPRHGNCNIFIKFHGTITDAQTVIVYPEYPNTMYISKDKQIYFKDYARET